MSHRAIDVRSSLQSYIINGMRSYMDSLVVGQNKTSSVVSEPANGSVAAKEPVTIEVPQSHLDTLAGPFASVLGGREPDVLVKSGGPYTVDEVKTLWLGAEAVRDLGRVPEEFTQDWQVVMDWLNEARERV